MENIQLKKPKEDVIWVTVKIHGLVLRKEKKQVITINHHPYIVHQGRYYVVNSKNMIVEEH